MVSAVVSVNGLQIADQCLTNSGLRFNYCFRAFASAIPTRSASDFGRKYSRTCQQTLRTKPSPGSGSRGAGGRSSGPTSRAIPSVVDPGLLDASIRSQSFAVVVVLAGLRGNANRTPQLRHNGERRTTAFSSRRCHLIKSTRYHLNPCLLLEDTASVKTLLLHRILQEFEDALRGVVALEPQPLAVQTMR